MKVMFTAIAVSMSAVFTPPVVLDITGRYFTHGIPAVMYVAVSVTAFAAIAFSLYLFLNDLQSILFHRSSKKVASRTT